METQQARRFTVADQQWFSLVTGDSNPLHVDPVWASTNFPGALVVHGLHVLLWGLDRHFTVHQSMQVGFIHATFLKPILIEDEVRAESAADGSVLRLLVRGEPTIVVCLRSQPGDVPSLPSVSVTYHPGEEARDRSGNEWIGLTGSVVLPHRVGELAEVFPSVSARLASALYGLAALSTLVGMECPGLRSLLSEFSVSTVCAQNLGSLIFRVKSHYPAFSRVEMEVSGFGIAGAVAAFAGSAVPACPSVDYLRTVVPATEFVDQQPLVIGASGGLGRATARLLAAGGAQPFLTWSQSRDAAQETARAVMALNGRCELVHFDVQSPGDGLRALAEANWSGEQLYYFASPRIFRRRLEAYQSGDLHDFLQIYVSGFYEVARGLLKIRHGARLVVLYPSSVAVDDRSSDLFEYKSAKLIGEHLCARLQERNAALTIKVVRLPRIATRQTQTFMNARSETPERVLLPIIKEVQSIFRSPQGENSSEALPQRSLPS
jgi:acyl dehydratase/NAD(P)-dependent dehydrogenase (short-subunit alcohol dehydrogenase family)